MYWWMRRGRSIPLVGHDYSHKPPQDIIYYEMLSNIIGQMRLHSGDEALLMVKNIPDLEINAATGEILNIKQDPAKIIALLIARYEKLSGRRLSFGLRSS